MLDEALCSSSALAPGAEEAPPCAWCGTPLAAFVETLLLPDTRYGAICPACDRLNVRERDGQVRQGRPDELPTDVQAFLARRRDA